MFNLSISITFVNKSRSRYSYYFLSGLSPLCYVSRTDKIHVEYIGDRDFSHSTDFNYCF